MIGNVLDKYEILQKIGEGGMATVYRGRHTTLGRDVAIKVLHPHLSRSPRNRSRFAREARAIEHLDHDNILKIFDYSGSEAEDCYIVTEFVDGVTLQTLVSERGRLPSEVVALIGLRLVGALGYAHQLGIIHRDLKPENVMVRLDGQVKLMDFGIARFLDEVHLTVTGALVGSPAYMSPEQAMEKVLDPRSDLFSLGTLLYHLLAGQLPFSGNNPSIILRNIIEGNRPEVIELVPDVSGSLADVVEGLLQVDPDDRPHDCAEVQRRLRACLDEVDLDPDDAAWALEAWLRDPEGYEERLRGHLGRVLIERGKQRLERQDHLGALRLFNRLLSVDEDNPQVLELVESMHAGMAQDDRPSRRIWAGVSVGAAAAAALLAWALWPSPAPPPLPGDGAVSLQPGTADDGAGAGAPAPVTDPPESPVGPTVSAPAPAPAPAAAPAPAPAAPPVASAPAPRRAAAPAAAPQAPGVLKVTVAGGWADIWVDGEKIGRTGKIPEIELTPGKHQVVLKNPFVRPEVRMVELASGETQVLNIDRLILLPSVARFDKGMNADCAISLDDKAQGTLADLQYRLEVSLPQAAHRVGIACPGAAARTLPVAPKTPGTVFAVEGLPDELPPPAATTAGAPDPSD